MKNQWTLLFGIFFALIVAVFAVINVDSVTVNYLFGTAQWPLILVILGSVLMGGLIIGSVGLFRMFILQRKVKNLEKQNNNLVKENTEYRDLIESLKRQKASSDTYQVEATEEDQTVATNSEQ